MAKAKATSAIQEEVTIPRSVLEQFVSLVEGLAQADRTYQSCQSTLFRNYTQAAYKSNKLASAMAQAKEALGTE